MNGCSFNELLLSNIFNIIRFIRKYSVEDETMAFMCCVIAFENMHKYFVGSVSVYRYIVTFLESILVNGNSH